MPSKAYPFQEDGTSRIVLEDGSGFLILEEDTPTKMGNLLAMFRIIPYLMVINTALYSLSKLCG